MKTTSSSLQILLHPLFLFSLGILLLNDFLLKPNFHNVLTGKLSDFAGLFCFPILFSAVFPAFRKWAAILTGVGFILWKTPLAAPLLEMLNTNPWFTFARVPDYTDYLALTVLPFSHFIINLVPHLQIPHSTIFSQWVLFIALFACTATSIAPCASPPKGTVLIDHRFTLKMPRSEVLDTLETLGELQWVDTLSKEGDSIQYPYNFYHPYYQLSKVQIEPGIYGHNSLKSIRFQLDSLKSDKTSLYLINITFQEEGQIQDWKRLKKISKPWRRKLKRKFKSSPSL